MGGKSIRNFFSSFSFLEVFPSSSPVFFFSLPSSLSLCPLSFSSPLSLSSSEQQSSACKFTFVLLHCEKEKEKKVLKTEGIRKKKLKKDNFKKKMYKKKKEEERKRFSSSLYLLHLRSFLRLEKD